MFFCANPYPHEKETVLVECSSVVTSAHHHIDLTILHALQGVQQTLPEKTACICLCSSAWWVTLLAYSLQLTGEKAEHEIRKHARSRTASGVCFLFPIQNGKGFFKTTQHSTRRRSKIAAGSVLLRGRKVKPSSNHRHKRKSNASRTYCSCLVVDSYKTYCWSHYWQLTSFAWPT